MKVVVNFYVKETHVVVDVREEKIRLKSNSTENIDRKVLHVPIKIKNPYLDLFPNLGNIFND